MKHTKQVVIKDKADYSVRIIRTSGEVKSVGEGFEYEDGRIVCQINAFPKNDMELYIFPTKHLKKWIHSSFLTVTHKIYLNVSGKINKGCIIGEARYYISGALILHFELLPLVNEFELVPFEHMER